VVVLNGELHDAKGLPNRGRATRPMNRRAHFGEKTDVPKRGQATASAQGDVHRMSMVVPRPRSVWHARPPRLRTLPPSPGPRATMWSKVKAPLRRHE
jgi:hypothetical protein